MRINQQQDRFQYTLGKIEKFKKNKILIKKNRKSIYFYRQHSNNTTYTGIICAISLKDYANKKIKAHEKTIRNREILFAKYLKEVKVHAEPVLIAHDGSLEHIIQKINQFSS